MATQPPHEEDYSLATETSQETARPRKWRNVMDTSAYSPPAQRRATRRGSRATEYMDEDEPTLEDMTSPTDKLSPSTEIPRPHSRMPRRSRARLAPPTPQERATRVLRESDAEAGEDMAALTPLNTPSKVSLKPRTRKAVYQPYSATNRRWSTKKQQPRSFLAYLRTMPRQRSLTVLITAIVALLLITPLAVSAIRPQPQQIITPLQSTTEHTTATPKTEPTEDPHQLVIHPPSTDHPSPPVFAQAAYLLDADTGETLYAHNPFTRLPILSTTKLMTALLAVEHGKLDQKIKIEGQIWKDISELSEDSSVMGIKKGETYTLKDLLYGLMLVSGNDAAVAIADSVSGNLNTFVSLMNQRAQQLGLRDTHFMNPHGLLEKEHYSSSHDLAILGKESLSNKLVKAISSTKEYDIPKTKEHPEFTLINGNQFLWWYPGVDGGKPGWDGEKNFVQVVSCTRNGKHLIGVAIHTKDWWTDMRSLMNWGFNSYTWISPAEVDKEHPIPYDADWNFFEKDQKELTIPTADKGRYYVYTGYSISGPIMNYFDKNGGLNTFGFPKSQPKAGNGSLIIQQFERGSIQCDIPRKACKKV